MEKTYLAIHLTVRSTGIPVDRFFVNLLADREAVG